jgi:WD40 repeat protein/serine/threonine protein kinase
VQLEQFLDEQLQGSARDEVAAHVATCPTCQESLERLTEAPVVLQGPLSSVRRLAPRPPDPSDAFLAQLKESPAPLLRSRLTEPIEVPEIAGYEILGELGRGGMGVVYKARQLGLNRTVALKMVLSGAHASAKDVARFRQEAGAVARLHHPNIVQIFDFGEVHGRPYFALELVEGDSLVQRLQGQPQPPDAAAGLIEVLARAAHYAHERGVIHRDLKPANVLLAATAGSPQSSGDKIDSRPVAVPGALKDYGVPKITDFGLAKQLGEQANATVSGEVVGTPAYMAPEQAAGQAHAAGPATDIYALGAILYEMLTGKPPFKGATRLDTALQVMHEEPVRPTRLQPHCPRDLETICLKCLEKAPRNRYASALELADDLRRFRRGLPVLARPVGAQERVWKWARRKPLIAGLAGGIVLVTLLGFGGVSWQWHEAAVARDQALKQKEDADRARNRARIALYDTRIAQSQLHWRLNDFASAVRSLENLRPNAGQPDQRGWEWHYLNGLYNTQLFTLAHKSGGSHGSVAVHPKGRWIASVVAGQREVKLWAADTGQFDFSLPASSTAHRLAFSPEGKLLAVADSDGQLVLWNVLKRREVWAKLKAHHQNIAGLAFSPDGKLLASASWDTKVRVWDVTTGALRSTLNEHRDRVHGVAFHPHPHAHRLASSDQEGKVRIWDTKEWGVVYRLDAHKAAVYGVAYSPDGKHLASAGSNGTLRIWAVVGNQLQGTQSVTSSAGAVLSVCFSPDGRYLAYGGSDATVRVWHVLTGIERIIFRGHTAAIESVRFSPDGRRVVSSCPEEGTVKVWDRTRHPEHSTLALTRQPQPLGQDPSTEPAGEVRVWDLMRVAGGPALARTGPDIEALAFQDQGRRLVSVTVGGKVQTWDAASGMLLAQRFVPLSPELITPALLVDFAPGGQRLAARAARDRRLVQVWDITRRSEPLGLRGARWPVFVVRFSPDGRHVATVGCHRAGADRPHEVKVWNATTGEELATFTGVGHVFNLAFSPDSRWLALGQEKGMVSVIDWASGQEVLREAKQVGAVTALAFSRDGQSLAVAGAEGQTVKVWDCTTWQAVTTAEAPGAVCDLAFSPDGKRLAGISRDLVKLWDAQTGQDLLILRGAPQRHRDPAFNPRLAFSPDGLRLAASNWDESISVWEAEPVTPAREEARRRAAEERAPLWHLQEAERCVKVKSAFGAAFHLKQLGDGRLPAPLVERKNQVVRELDALRKEKVE